MNLDSLSVSREQRDALDTLWNSLAQRVDSSPDDISCLNADEQVVFAVMLFYCEVYNGGIEQFYFNSSGSYYEQTVSGLNALGADQTRGLLVVANRLLFAGKVPPTDSCARDAMMNTPRALSWVDALDVLDTAIDDSKDNLISMLAAFAVEKGLMSRCGVAIP